MTSIYDSIRNLIRIIHFTETRKLLNESINTFESKINTTTHNWIATNHKSEII